MSIEIRALRPEDFAAANALWCFMNSIVLRGDDNPEAFSKFLERNPDCCYAAWLGNDLLVGAIMAGHDGRCGYLYHLAVKPGYRRQGIGRKWLKSLWPSWMHKASANFMCSSNAIILPPHLFGES